MSLRSHWISGAAPIYWRLEAACEKIVEGDTSVPALEELKSVATEKVVVDRTFTMPDDTGGRAVIVDVGDGYSLRATSQDGGAMNRP